MGRLLLVRHGQVQSGDAGQYLGHTDISLDAEGVAQAERLRDRLASETIRTVYSSDLKRALRTAEVIASAHQACVIPCPELREIDFGQFEGMTFAEIERLCPEAAKLWLEADPEMRFPGGESLGALAIRVSSFARRLDKDEATDTALVVGHGGPLRLLVCQLLGLDLIRWWQLCLDLASITVVEIYPEGAVLRLLNDVCHLAGV